MIRKTASPTYEDRQFVSAVGTSGPKENDPKASRDLTPGSNFAQEVSPMRGSKNRSTSSLPLAPSLLPNAFNLDFLRRFGERELPPTAGEANAAGPWVIEELSSEVFGVSRVDMGYALGYIPTAIFLDRWLALAAAVVLPGLGQTPLLIRRKREDGGPAVDAR